MILNDPLRFYCYVCLLCRSDSGVIETSNRASQGLVRYVDVVTTRNGEVANRGVASGGNQKCNNISLLGTATNDQTPCMNISENAAEVLKQETGDESCNKDNDSRISSSSRKSEGCSNRNNKSLNKNSGSCRQNGSTCTKDSIHKEATLVSKNGRSFVRNVEVPRSSSDTSKQDAGNIETDCCQIPSTECAELASNRGSRELIYGNGTCQLNRVSKFHIRGSETYAVRMKNQEGRTYLSDVANVESKNASDATWAKHSSEKTIGAPSKTILNKPKNAEIAVGPRPCSLRLQAGSSNILLDNATSYAPVLYTSRHNGEGGDVSSAVLVHIARSRSVSASSTDEAQHRGDGKSSCVHSPTETEL